MCLSQAYQVRVRDVSPSHDGVGKDGYFYVAPTLQHRNINITIKKYGKNINNTRETLKKALF